MSCALSRYQTDSIFTYITRLYTPSSIVTLISIIVYVYVVLNHFTFLCFNCFCLCMYLFSLRATICNKITAIVIVVNDSALVSCAKFTIFADEEKLFTMLPKFVTTNKQGRNQDVSFRGGDESRVGQQAPSPPARVSGERCELPQRGLGRSSRPPEGFPLFSALRMASPDTIMQPWGKTPVAALAYTTANKAP